MKADQEAFLSCTTRIGFNLTLSRTMMEMLCAISDDVEWDRMRWPSLYMPNNWMATERALTKRGLIRRYSSAEHKKRARAAAENKVVEMPIPYALTDIGAAVVQMLKVGGLFISAEAARDKLQRRGHE